MKEKTFTSLMDNINQTKRLIFSNLLNMVITNEDFQKEMKMLDNIIENAYYQFIADNRIISTTEQVMLDMGIIEHLN